VGVSARAVALTGADQLVVTGGAMYRGFSIRETAGAAAVVRIYDGASASGTLLDTVSLVASESARELYGSCGIWATAGIFVDVVSGSVEGSIRIG
jgi:hypothetical protein